MELYDVIIIGAGPAGLTAAIYLARAQYRVLVLEKEGFGGQITITSDVVNYPGIMETDGKDLTQNMLAQAQNFGAEFTKGEAVELDLESDRKKIKLKDGRVLEGLGVVLALGASPRTAGFKGEIEYRGRGVAYCATCDGEFFTDKDIFVVGGGFAAAEEAIFLTKYGKKVTILVREDDFTCAQSIVDSVLANDKIRVMYNTEVQEVGGEGSLQYAIIKNNKTETVTRYEAGPNETFGLFVFAGYVPATKIIKDKVTLNDAGYIICDKNQKTNIDGVYGAGDVCIKVLRQVVTAVSDGAVAATELEKHVSAMYKKLNLPPREPVVKRKKAKPASESKSESDNTGFLDDSAKQQLEDVFSKLTKDIHFRAILNDRSISSRLKEFLEDLCTLSPHLKCTFETTESKDDFYPEIRLETDNKYSGISFHGIPGGHEMNSFVVAVYNLAGPGQPIAPEIKERITALNKPIKITIAATLSCTMCPDLVMASQRIASLNPMVEAHMVDLNLFPELKEKYDIMSVPAMLINENSPVFGKKDIPQLLNILEG